MCLVSAWDKYYVIRFIKCVFNFLRFFERTLYKSNYIIFISSWCGTHTKIRGKLVDIVTARSQKITVWDPQRTPLGILRVKEKAITVMRSHLFVLLSSASFEFLNSLTDFHETWYEFCCWRPPQRRTFRIPITVTNNPTDAENCKAAATLGPCSMILKYSNILCSNSKAVLSLHKP